MTKSNKRLQDKIEDAEAKAVNFVDGKALPFVKDEYGQRKAAAWAKAFDLVGAA